MDSKFDSMTGFTNLLFVPANRPERYGKAADSGADLICIDLEDSVPADEKQAARKAVLKGLADLDRSKTAIRINGLKTADGLADLLELAAIEHKPGLVFLPMVESEAEVEIAHAILGDNISGLVPLIETVKGLRAGDAIASAAGVSAMMFGGGDFSAQLGTELAWEPLLAARGEFILSCASAGIMAVDVPYIHLEDEAGLAEEAQKAKALGFHAKAAIHPRQIDAIARAMKPTAAEISEAKEAVAAFDAAGGRAISHNGRMLEAPVMQRYRHILATA